MRNNKMVIYDIQKVTLIDFPGEVAATVFTFGCNMRCPFCHNPELVIGNTYFQPIPEKEILDYLNKRKNVLGGVCITGGEPLLQNELDKFIEEIHKLKLKVKLDTNGTMPEKLKNLKADFIAMDIKTSLPKYNKLGYNGRDEIVNNIKESIKWIIGSGINYEFRTTVVPELVTFDDIKEIVELIKGAKEYFLDQFRPKNVLDKNWENLIPYNLKKLEEMKKIITDSGIGCKIRNL
jgi:pyruvate formate lyase activating enzyme